MWAFMKLKADHHPRYIPPQEISIQIILTPKNHTEMIIRSQDQIPTSCASICPLKINTTTIRV